MPDFLPVSELANFLFALVEFAILIVLCGCLGKFQQDQL